MRWVFKEEIVREDNDLLDLNTRILQVQCYVITRIKKKRIFYRIEESKLLKLDKAILAEINEGLDTYKNGFPMSTNVFLPFWYSLTYRGDRKIRHAKADVTLEPLVVIRTKIYQIHD